MNLKTTRTRIEPVKPANLKEELYSPANRGEAPEETHRLEVSPGSFVEISRYGNRVGLRFPTKMIYGNPHNAGDPKELMKANKALDMIAAAISRAHKPIIQESQKKFSLGRLIGLGPRPVEINPDVVRTELLIPVEYDPEFRPTITAQDRTIGITYPMGSDLPLFEGNGGAQMVRNLQREIAKLGILGHGKPNAMWTTVQPKADYSKN
ncbi:hypothetical protein HY995_05115 [Candidatus Micrarchaeota archaeon]|nr:hypothetical protein [Candidatus Micrarchaeota archaeon]MBI5177436.1 hypothetical protein [Candidatus Micrarchaeota archaeon]